MVCFVNVASVDRIIYAIFNSYNQRLEWRNRTLRLLHTQLDITREHNLLDKEGLVC